MQIIILNRSNDGNVVFKGIKNVNTIGERSSKIQIDTLKRLMNCIKDIYFFTLDDNYCTDNNATNMTNTRYDFAILVSR